MQIQSEKLIILLCSSEMEMILAVGQDINVMNLKRGYVTSLILVTVTTTRRGGGWGFSYRNTLHRVKL